ncbi:MAG: FAD-dependent oxidoreductase, partial [Planctomycetes bacterium]|nr:FAD-dependent oxidoreductase [Planctomycetota bacterium]
MQAALDCANAGFNVYLLEQQPAIGGNMVRLDKTFPTNDCAMCTISPRLVETEKHPNIELITCSQVQSIEGEPGNFTARLLQKPRYVYLDKCNACGDCSAVCPVRLANPFDEELGPTTAIRKYYPQAIPNKYAVTKEGVSPCRVGCPAGVNAHAYVALIAQRKYAEALEVVRRVLPFAAICGRLCHHPCETECNRAEVDEAVSIRYLKRFIADKVRQTGEKPPEPVAIDKKEKVAVVGAGPAGLTCALRLREKGYAVTVFEASDKPGGMLTSCIPDYRVPAERANYEIDRITASGVEIKTNTRIGKDITLAHLKQNYNAVFVAVGYQDPAKIPLEGSEAEGVMYGISFLKEAKKISKEHIAKSIEEPKNSKPYALRSTLGKRVLVIGGGNVAIDCAKSALRLGAKQVSLVCLETRDLEHPDRMPAHEWEIEEAEEEGIKLNCLLGPQKVVTENGKIKGLATTRCESVYDFSSGAKKFAPKFSCDLGPVIEADTIIIATGQRADTAGLDEIAKTPFKSLKADPVTMETNIKGVFAGGDIRRGPASVIEAVADGNEAAISIERYFKGEDLRAGRGVKPEGVPLPKRKIEKKPRVAIPKQDAAERRKSFVEVEKLFDEEAAVAEASRCLSCSVCCECLQCVAACQPKAINHGMKPEARELSVGAVVLTAGGDMFDATLKGEYGFGRFPNVVTSIQYERILSASGPFAGKISQPSDSSAVSDKGALQPTIPGSNSLPLKLPEYKGHPKRIAWIQCVGSRDHSIGNDYCSSVCCMYATKQAIITREHEADIEVSVFYNDLRSFGKGYEYYVTSAKQHGVKYIKSIISNIKENPVNRSLLINYFEGGTGSDEPTSNKINTLEFDMIVLSVGFVPSASARELCKNLGVKLNPYGFNSVEGGDGNEFTYGVTNKPGIYAAGVFNSPMDIPESVMGASGAAALAGELLAPARNTMVTKKVYPPERDVKGESPRVGVFICRCGTNIARVVDVQSLVDFAKKLPDVVYAEENLYTCSTDTQQHIIKMIQEHKLNRVIVSSCTPRTHEPLFQEMLCEAGLNKYLFEMANIRDQCSWVHMDLPLEATAKSKDLVKMAVNRARYLEPLKEQVFEVVPNALVIGGGLSGITSALSLARQGFMTYLVEKSDRLGGNLWNISRTLDGQDPTEYLRRILQEVKTEPMLKVYENAQVTEVNGSIGNYTSKIKYNSSPVTLTQPGRGKGLGDSSPTAQNDISTKEEEIRHGVIIVAIGGVEAKPSASGGYLYGQSLNIITQLELEKKLANHEFRNPQSAVRNVVMIQCVEAREPEHPYCSRICCTQAIKNALRIKKINPDANIYILYRDIMTYGIWELYYRQAREAGIIFIKYELDKKPQITQIKDGKLSVQIFDGLIQKEISIPADLLVLSMPVRPQPEAQKLGTTLKVPLNTEGFFLEAHLKLRPLDFANEGMFLAGLAHFPKHINESIAQAKGTAARAAAILSNRRSATVAASAYRPVRERPSN